MSAIPEAVDARCARRGVTRRVLLRVAMLGGLLIAGWLLGSGTALAHEDDLGYGDQGHDKIVQQHTSVVRLRTAPPPGQGRPSGLLGTPSMAGSTVQDLLRAASVPRPRVHPPAQVPILTPVLAHVAKTTKPATMAATNFGPVWPAQATSTRAATDQPAAAPPAALAVQEVAVQEVARPAPAPTVVATGLAAVGGSSVATPVSPGARLPVAGSVTEPSSGGVAPVAPAPASPPPATTTAMAGAIGGTGSGAGTKSDRFITLSGRADVAGPAPTRLRRYPAAGGVPQSVAQQPSTSPD